MILTILLIIQLLNTKQYTMLLLGSQWLTFCSLPLSALHRPFFNVWG